MDNITVTQALVTSIVLYDKGSNYKHIIIGFVHNLFKTQF